MIVQFPLAFWTRQWMSKWMTCLNQTSNRLPNQTYMRISNLTTNRTLNSTSTLISKWTANQKSNPISILNVILAAAQYRSAWILEKSLKLGLTHIPPQANEGITAPFCWISLPKNALQWWTIFFRVFVRGVRSLNMRRPDLWILLQVMFCIHFHMNIFINLLFQYHFVNNSQSDRPSALIYSIR